MPIVSNAPPRAKRADLFANVVVTNQFGQQFRFLDELVRGRSAVINTTFTICRGTCSGTNALLKRLRAPLSQLFGKRASILTMTIDPVNDTREVLAEYAAQFKAMTPSAPDQCDWHFLTATPDDIEALRRSLGFYDLDRRVDADITRHAAMLLFGNDRTDRWSTSPTQLRDGLIFEPIRRTLGETTQERYGIRKS